MCAVPFRLAVHASFRSELKVFLAAALVTVVFTVQRAEAAQVQYYVRAMGKAQTSGFGISDPQLNSGDTGLVQATSISSGPFTATSTESSPAHGAAFSKADLGALHGSASFSAQDTFGPADGHGEGGAFWGDTVTITSNTLAPGTAVNFLASLSLHRTIVGSGTGLTIQADAEGPFGLSITDSFDFPNATQSQSVSTQLRVGDTYSIASSLTFTADGTAFPNPVSGSIDILNTALFNLVSLDPAASYTTLSGVTYVPEPASFVLAAIGALFVGVGRRLRFGRATRQSG